MKAACHRPVTTQVRCCVTTSGFTALTQLFLLLVLMMPCCPLVTCTCACTLRKVGTNTHIYCKRLQSVAAAVTSSAE